MRRTYALLIGMLWCVAALAQNSLSIVDALPPYRLSAFLQGNGHFSVATSYTGLPKPLIYREDGSGNRPVNFTSHLHIRVDGVVYKMPYEVDETTGLPPANQMAVRGLFRDTVLGRPRINARLEILPAALDTIDIVFTMEPVKRPSGAFVRMSVTIVNRGVRNHVIGVLMLVDTKIGDNDRAPIATSFGYRTVETQYQQGVAQGMPEYWIALEGTPLQPGLTARGNLIETDLIAPTMFILGNWVDDPSRGTIGLRLNEWDERGATGLDYSDSSVLLIWDDAPLGIGQRALRAATEIGLVDSLTVGSGGGGGGGSLGVAGPGGGGGGGGCIAAELNDEDPCGTPGFHPYLPDTLEPLFLVTNTDGRPLDGLSVEVVNAPPGVDVVRVSTPVIPTLLQPAETGVGSISLALRPRLQAQSYRVPIEVRATGLVPPFADTLCITVPGVQADVTMFNLTTPILCPGLPDTVNMSIRVNGPRCLPLTTFEVIGTPAATIQLRDPLPIILNTRAVTQIPVVVQSGFEGNTLVRVRIVVREFETLRDGDTTFVDHEDTITVTVNARLSEFDLPGSNDTLDLGSVCLNDTVRTDVLIQNTGGCSFDITSIAFTDNQVGRFFTAPTVVVPLTLQRAETSRNGIRFTSTTTGTFTGLLEVRSAARPGSRILPIRVRVTQPDLVVADTIDLDTICVGTATTASLPVRSPVPCPVGVDTLELTGPVVSTSFTSAFSVPANGQVSVPLSITPTVAGPFSETILLRSSEAGNRTIVVRGVAGSSRLAAPAALDLGDVRVGATQSQTITLSNTGTLPITVATLTTPGPSGGEYSATLAVGTLPVTILPGGTIDVVIAVTPSDIETRPATLIVGTARALCETFANVSLTTRGIRPLLSADRPTVDVGRQCIPLQVDTAVTFTNRGNAPLRITEIRTSNALLSADAGVLPIQLDPDQAVRVALRVQAQQLGPRVHELRVVHDGEFAVEADSVITVGVHGTVCGRIAADSSVGVVGEDHAIQLRWVPDETAPLTLDEVAAILGQRGDAIDINVVHDARVIRGVEIVAGAAADAATVFTALPASFQIQATRLIPSANNLLASVRVHLLRGGVGRTSLRVTLNDIAGGDAEVLVDDGDVRSLICAFDDRALLVPGFALMQDLEQGHLVATGVQPGTTLTLYTLDGRQVFQCPLQAEHGGVVWIATSTLPRVSGTCIGVLRCDGHVATAVIQQMNK